MLSIAGIIAQIIEEYHEDALKNKRESRIVAPGLTWNVAQAIHNSLIENNIVSYLVVGDDVLPDEEKMWITPVGLTSQRIGSFVAITIPGQLAQMQDSIRGSGGTIRSVVYSEEWPWIDNRSESFRFDGPVLERLVAEWTTDQPMQRWLYRYVLHGLIPSSRSASNRAALLLEELLGSFDPKRFPQIDDVRLKMLFHTGLAYTEGDISNVDKLLQKRIKSCQKIVDKCRKEDSIRTLALERIPEVIAEPDREDVSLTVSTFLDCIGRSQTLDHGILSFFRCWIDSPDQWMKLPSGKLESLFEVEDRETAEVTFDITCDQCIKSDDGKTVALFHGQPLSIHGTFSLPKDDLERYKWSLCVSHRRSTLESVEIDSSEGTYSFTIDSSSSFSNYRRAVPLRLSLLADKDVRAEARLKLHLCGPDRPAFVLVEKGFDVIDAQTHDGDESPDRRIEIDVPTHLYMLAYNLNEPLLTDADEKKLPIIDIEETGIWRSGARVDPMESPSGQVVRVCTFEKLAAVVSFEAKDIERGAFTIEDELRNQISRSRKEDLNHLIDIFAGKPQEPSGKPQEPYFKLGGINERARGRICFANDMTAERGWRPLLTDLLHTDFDTADAVGDFVVTRGQIDASGFAHLSIPDNAITLVREYASHRKLLLDYVTKSLDIADGLLEHPIYASHPVFNASNATELENLLTGYLNTYVDILRYVDEERANLEWSQLFVLLHLDCVIHWDDTPLRNTFLLAGPWHPLVLSKRYMVQSLILKRAQALSDDDGKKFNFLAELLNDIPGFRWLPGLHRDDRLLEPLYAIVTSDPGWHLAIKEDLPTVAGQSEEGSIVNLLKSLSKSIGLDSTVFHGRIEYLTRSSLVDFARAFPSRRSISVNVRDCYPIPQVVSSVNDLLHDEEGPSEFGAILPGGVHLYTEAGVTDVSDVVWSDPPLQVYHTSSKGGVANMIPDLLLLAPQQELSFLPTNDKYAMPRGLKMQSVLSESVTWLTGGQSQLPSTIVFEHDSVVSGQADLGSLFVNTQSRIGSSMRNRLAVLRAADLPVRLSSPWAVFPGAGTDPAVFVKYVKDGTEKSIEERALWDFRFDLSGKRNTYFVLSTIPKGFMVAVNGFFDKEDVASQFIQELGALGVAIGGEALKSGRRAHGVIGLVGAMRLIAGLGGSRKGAIVNDNRCVGFLVPVDSFHSFFGKQAGSAINEFTVSKRTDLLAIQMVLPEDEQSELVISSCGIESKFVSQTFGRAQAVEALGQAKTSNDAFSSLVQISLQDWATPERLGLLAMLKFGLRVSSVNANCRAEDWTKKECTIARMILQGQFRYEAGNQTAIVVSTEAGFPGVAESNKLADGLWVRLNRDHWPGISDSGRLEQIREEISCVFDVPRECLEPVTPPTATSTGSDTTAESTSEDEVTTLVTVPIEPKEDPVTTSDEDAIEAEEGSVDSKPDSDKPEGIGPLERIFLGVDDARRPVYFDPQSPVDRLDNLNVMITGSSGTGKTQLLKYLICKIREQARNVLILDFKKDFADDDVFMRMGSLEPVYVSFDGLPFNPLIPYPVRHPGSGEMVIQIGQHISGIASVLKRTYRLGAQQQVAVKNAITDAFDSVGIPTSGTTTFSDTMEFPDFSSIGERLQATNQQAYNRLDPLFTLDLFRADQRRSSFHSLVNRSMILDLSHIPNDEIKNTLSELIVLSAHAYYNAQPHSGRIRQFLVFDEAHRVLESAFMIGMVRECRAYGVGIVLSSQYPTDFPAEISSSVATKILHGNGRDADRVKTIIQMIGCTGREGDVSNLTRFQAFLDNRHFPHSLIRTMNYPLYIIWSHLEHETESSRQVLNSLEGIDPDKLPVNDLIKQLENLGLVEDRGGVIRRV